MATTAKVRAGTEKDEAGEFVYELHNYAVPEDWTTIEGLHAMIAAVHGEDKAKRTVNAVALRGYKIAKESGFRGRVKAKEDPMPDTDNMCQTFMDNEIYATQTAQTGVERMAKMLKASGMDEASIQELLDQAEAKGL